ncbi:MAG: hypothetical protein IPN90_12025 [Elusimicrobia bacterium]|nr:hypothetical protein [Elusimicrobiota bacterium]
MSLHRPHFFRPKKWISFVSVLRANWEFQVNGSLLVRTPQTKEPTPGLGVGPSASTTYRKWCSYPDRIQVHSIKFVNTFHDYRLAMGLPM